MGKGLKAAIFGGAVGAAIGVLCAPRAGRKTRAMLAKKTESLWGKEAQDKGTILGEVAKTTKTAVEAGQSIFTEAQKSKIVDFTKGATEKGQQIFENTSSKVEEFKNENVRPIFSEKNDELRKKIDNARAKIASQVAQNISEDKVEVKPATKKAPAKPEKDIKKETKKSEEKKAKKPAKKTK